MSVWHRYEYVVRSVPRRLFVQFERLAARNATELLRLLSFVTDQSVLERVAEHVFAHPCMNDREVAHRQHSENMSAANEALRAGGDALRPVLRAGGVPDGYYHSDYWSEYGARLALQNAADGA